MKVGTDGVLLGAWASIMNAKRILDVGTGTGLISLMLAQRNNKSTIDAIEIDESAYTQANQNFQQSNWTDRLQIYHQDFQSYSASFKKKYDLIISNPPYFNNSLKNDCHKKSKARHTDSLSYADLIDGVSLLLETTGIFCVILPAFEKNNFTHLAFQKNLHLSRCLSIKPTPSKAPKRILMEFSFSLKENSVEEELIIEEFGRHNYSEDYKKLTKDFYLNF